MGGKLLTILAYVHVADLDKRINKGQTVYSGLGRFHMGLDCRVWTRRKLGPCRLG